MKRDCLFANCISLGYACATTQAMKVNGLRSCSGPFDWVISRFSSVLKIVEDDFADYLQKKNLETVQGKATEFYDKKYGFYYMHDIEESFDSEYEKVVSKYSRRITAFRKMVVHPTVFFRTVMNNDEIRFINENREYIQAVIKKLNNNSEIFFFTTSDADNISWGTSFRLSIKNWDGEKFWGHWIFPQKVHEVVKTLISPTQRKESIAFFLNHITPKDALGITLGLAKNNYAFRNIFSDFFRSCPCVRKYNVFRRLKLESNRHNTFAVYCSLFRYTWYWTKAAMNLTSRIRDSIFTTLDQKLYGYRMETLQRCNGKR